MYIVKKDSNPAPQDEFGFCYLCYDLQSSISSIWVGFSFVAEIPNQITKNLK